MGEAETILRLLSEGSKVKVVVGEYRGREPGGMRALVDFEGGRVPVQPAAAITPVVNDSVWVLIVDGLALMLGTTIMKPGEGTVVTVAVDSITVDTVIGQVTATYDAGAPISAGNIVKLLWNEGCHVVGVKAGSVPPPIPPPAPGAGGGRVTQTFTAVDSGSHRSANGWWTNDVWASSSNRGLWFYGTKIKDTIPATAKIIAAEIYVPNPKNLTGARNFSYHGYASRPAGAPTVTTVTTLAGTSGWVPIPTSIVDFLKANVGGVGFNTGGENTWPGVQSDGQSGALRITYDS